MTVVHSQLDLLGCKRVERLIMEWVMSWLSWTEGVRGVSVARSQPSSLHWNQFFTHLNSSARRLLTPLLFSTRFKFKFGEESMSLFCYSPDAARILTQKKLLPSLVKVIESESYKCYMSRKVREGELEVLTKKHGDEKRRWSRKPVMNEEWRWSERGKTAERAGRSVSQSKVTKTFPLSLSLCYNLFPFLCLHYPAWMERIDMKETWNDGWDKKSNILA